MKPKKHALWRRLCSSPQHRRVPYPAMVANVELPIGGEPYGGSLAARWPPLATMGLFPTQRIVVQHPSSPATTAAPSSHPAYMWTSTTPSDRLFIGGTADQWSGGCRSWCRSMEERMMEPLSTGRTRPLMRRGGCGWRGSNAHRREVGPLPCLSKRCEGAQHGSGRRRHWAERADANYHEEGNVRVDEDDPS